jgi:SAM-dependent methyltransferase
MSSGSLGPQSLSFERIADRYDETRGGEERGRRFAAGLAPLLDAREPVLEVGIGTGVVAKGLTEAGFRVLGVDISHSMAARARDRLGPRVALGDARRLPIATSAAVQAYSVWVLHVVGDLPGVLAEVARILRPGGRYLVVPAQPADRPADPIGGTFWDLQHTVDPARTRDDGEDRLRQLAGPALRVVESRQWEAFDYEEAPAETIAKIESRSFSILWDLPDDTWRTVVEPTLTWLRSLPDPDRPIARRSTDRVVVLERQRD